MQELRANTQVIVTVGPFVDVGDGFTPQTDITLGGNEAEILKHGSTTVVSIAAATWAAVTSCRGYYSLTLTTSHTDTEGMLVVIVQDDSDCLPVKQEYMVLSEAAWDSKYVAKDSGFMDVNVKAISEDETAANNAESFFDGTGYAGTNNVIPTVTATTTATNLTNLPSIPANWLTTAGINDGAFTAAKFAASSLDGKGNWNVGKTGYTVSTVSDKTGYSLTATTGLGNQTSNITGNLSGSVGSVTGAAGSVTGAVGSVTGAVGSVAGNVDGNVSGSVASNLELGPAEVNAEVVDVLFTDTDAEPAQGLPAATTTLADKIGFLYKAWRNKSTQTATQYSLYNDDTSTIDHKATVSDDATTATKGEVATGP